MKAILLLALVVGVAGAETLAPAFKSVRMFRDDNGQRGAEVDRTFPTGAGRIHIGVELARPRPESTEVGWTVYQLSSSGEGVPIMDRSSPAANFDRLSFSCVRTPEWQPGRYRIDLAFDGAVVQATEFTVVKDASSVKVLTLGLHQCDPAGLPGAPVTWFNHIERRLWLRMVAKGCGGLPLHATLTPVDGDGTPAATFDDPGQPESSKVIDLCFQRAGEWTPGAYRAEVRAGGQVVATLDLRID